jgi:hypothetical protein
LIIFVGIHGLLPILPKKIWRRKENDRAGKISRCLKYFFVGAHALAPTLSIFWWVETNGD